MPYSNVTYSGLTGAQSDFPVTLNPISRSHIAVSVNGTATPFTWLNNDTIRVLPAPSGTLKITRVTPIANLAVTFSDGTVYSANRHNTANTQLLYAAQEATDLVADQIPAITALTNTTIAARDSALGYANQSLGYANLANTYRQQAAASAGTAASHASSAASSASVALASASTAASLAAAAGAPVFSNTTEGLAGTMHGKLFFVPETGGGLRVWKNTAGVAVHAGYIGASGGLNPLEFGAKGDGVTDDGAALNLVFAALRAAVLAGTNPVIDGRGLEYFTTISINSTGIRGGASTIWNWRVKDITIIGACAGKPVLDCIGTRGGRWDNVLIWGDKTNRPTVGWQFARASVSPFDFCDNHTFMDCHVDGFFTVAARHAYGQESCFYGGCHWWNRDICGTTSIIVGHSDPVPMYSDYMAPMTGGTSMINNGYIRCEDRSVSWEENRNYAISNISNTFPAVVTTTTTHNFVPGEKVSIWIVQGMNGAFDVYNGVVGAVTATTFELAGYDATGLTAYAGSGYATRPQTKPTIIMGRCNGTTFYNHYIVNVGTHAVEFVFPDSSKPIGIEFKSVLVEGAPNLHIMFKAPGYDTSIHGFRWEVEQQRVHEAIFKVDPATTGLVRIANGAFIVHNAFKTSRPLCSNGTKTRMSMLNMALVSPLEAEIHPLQHYVSFLGTTYSFDATEVQYHGGYHRKPVIYAPVFTDNSGSSWYMPEVGGALLPSVNLGQNVGGPNNRVSTLWGYQVDIGTTATDGIILRAGTGVPNGAVTANPGSYYSQTGATAVLWFKKTGVGTNTGWVVVA